MACGTPVIATNRGSMSELIIPGTNGQLVEGGEQVAVELGYFDPALVRSTVERRFNRDRMVDEYLSLYLKLLERTSTTSRRGVTA